jgi:hypothetical protein
MRNLQIALINVLFHDIIATENKEALNTSLKNELLMKINISIMCLCCERILFLVLI